MKKYVCPSAEFIEFATEPVMTTSSSICECGSYGSNFDMDDEDSGCEAITTAMNEIGYNANNLPWLN